MPNLVFATGPDQDAYMQSSLLPFSGQKPLPSSKVMKRAERVVVNVRLLRIKGTSLDRYVLPSEMDDEQKPEAPRMLLQSFGVSHMKLGAGVEALLRSLTKTQSVTVPQLDGFARYSLLQRAVLLVMS